MILKNNKTKIMELFFINPSKKFRVRQIEREAGVALPSAIRYAGELAKENIIKKEIIGGSIFFSADLSSEDYKFEKTIFNLYRVRPIVMHIRKKHSNPPIILFGSYSRGEDIEESDIDLYVESPLKKIDPGHPRVQVFLHKNINEIKSDELRNNILNGIRLNGYVEVF